jgi:FMN reductase
MKIAVIVGNPKPNSKTLEAATLLARQIGHEPHLVVDLATLGAKLLEFGDPEVAKHIEAIAVSDLVIVATPTYKATYTGLLKLFLDQVPMNGLGRVHAVPLMLGGAPGHALAPELLLKPVLVELGAICPFPGLFLLDSDFRESPKLAAYAQRVASYLAGR